jgi:hypothetical protein
VVVAAGGPLKAASSRIPAPPTKIRHQPKGAKPWRLTKSRSERTTSTAAMKAAMNPTATRPICAMSMSARFR